MLRTKKSENFDQVAPTCLQWSDYKHPAQWSRVHRRDEGREAKCF
jgi:hypothetical protein